MNLQDMGSIGELVAAVATLVYLAVQIRQSSETDAPLAFRNGCGIFVGNLTWP